MQCYRYQNLEGNDSIRLVTLHSANDEASPISCTITHHRLSEPDLTYEALSYTWGDPSSRISISCPTDQGKLEIQGNCHSALRHLRLKEHDRLLWIDAICINQTNIQERTTQVRRMDRIFTKAFAVVVYLGEATSGSNLLFEELAEADKSFELTGTFDRPYPNNGIIRELEELIQRPWFHRVWVLQEIHANDSVSLMCGSAHASWKALNNCIQGYDRDTEVTKKYRPYVMDIQDGRWNFHAAVAIQMWQLLINTRYYLASDRRDRVFALVSLISTGREEANTLVDYAQSVDKVFTEVALFLLPHIGLRLLLAMRHGHSYIMPSWVPDWSQNSDLDRATLLYAPEPNVEKLGTFTVQNSGTYLPKLIVQGVRCGTVSCMGDAFLFDDLEDAKNVLVETVHYISSSKSEVDPVAGNAHIPPQILTFLRSIPTNLAAEFLMRGYASGDTRFVVSDSTFKSLHQLQAWASLPGKIQRFQESLQNCRLSASDNGDFLVAPENAREGDVICMFKGSLLPCLLRKTTKGNWLLISGDCYMVGDKSWFVSMESDEWEWEDVLQSYGPMEEEFIIE